MVALKFEAVGCSEGFGRRFGEGRGIGYVEEGTDAVADEGGFGGCNGIGLDEEAVEGGELGLESGGGAIGSGFGEFAAAAVFEGAVLIEEAEAEGNEHGGREQDEGDEGGEQAAREGQGNDSIVDPAMVERVSGFCQGLPGAEG